MIYIIGAGAQAKYVSDILQDSYVERRIFDPIGKKIGSLIGGVTVEKYELSKIPSKVEVVICVSNYEVKKKLVEEFEEHQCIFPTLVHKDAVISPYASVGFGCIVNACAVIQNDAVVGNFCMIHSHVIIEHDCKVGNYVNLAPQVTLAGHCSVGNYSHINIGSILIPSIIIGSKTTIGAGSLVLTDIPDESVAYGNPCRIVRTTNRRKLDELSRTS